VIFAPSGLPSIADHIAARDVVMMSNLGWPSIWTVLMSWAPRAAGVVKVVGTQFILFHPAAS
jgi:hypothetical protein